MGVPKKSCSQYILRPLVLSKAVLRYQSMTVINWNFSPVLHIYRNVTINTFKNINIFHSPFIGEWVKKHRCVATLLTAVMWIHGRIFKYENIIMRFKLNWRGYREILPSSFICLDLIYFFTDHKPDFPYTGHLSDFYSPVHNLKLISSCPIQRFASILGWVSMCYSIISQNTKRNSCWWKFWQLIY